MFLNSFNKLAGRVLSGYKASRLRLVGIIKPSRSFIKHYIIISIYTNYVVTLAMERYLLNTIRLNHLLIIMTTMMMMMMIIIIIIVIIIIFAIMMTIAYYY